MRHALVIGEDRPAAALVESRLWQAGFTSVAHAWNEQEAWESLGTRTPTLIVALADPADGLPTDFLHRLSDAADAPVLVAAPRREQALDCVGRGARLEGPYPLDRIQAAMDQALAAPRALAAACG